MEDAHDNVAAERLCQLHMRCRDDVTQRRLLDQRTVSGYAELDEWAIEIRKKYDSELPEGWVYELVLSDSEHFIKEGCTDAEGTD